MSYSVINGQEYLHKKDDVIILCPGDTHYFTGQSEELEIFSLCVEKNEYEILWSLIFDAGENNPSINDFIIFNNKEVGVFLEKECSSLLSYPMTSLCRFYVMFLLKKLLEINVNNVNSSPLALTTALSKMSNKENLRDGIKALLRLTNYSISQLERLMKKHFGVTVHEYIRNERLLFAHHLIISSGESIEEISESLGYASFSHFNRIFKAKYGITPSMLRRKHNFKSILR